MMNIIVNGESIPFSIKIQTDRNGKTRQYLRASVVVATDPVTLKKSRKEITASSESDLRNKIAALQYSRPIRSGLDISLVQYLERWFDDNKDSLSPKFQYAFSTMIEKDIKPYLADILLLEADETCLRKFFQSLLKDRGLKTAGTVRNSLIRPMNEAVQKNLIYYNPVKFIRIPKPQYRAPSVLSGKEAATIIHLCSTDKKPVYGNAIELTLRTGLRISECIGLSADDYRTEDHSLRIHRQLQYVSDRGYILIMNTKNGEERRLYLDQESVNVIERQLEILRQYKQQAGTRWYNEFNCLFTNKEGHHLTHAGLQYHFNKIRNQIGRPDLRFHDLRHTCATVIFDKTGDINTVKKVMGHKNTRSTEHYVHTSPEKQREALNMIEQYAHPSHDSATESPQSLKEKMENERKKQK